MDCEIMEVDSTEPDSTVNIEEDKVPPSEPQTPLQHINRHLEENQNLCFNMLAASAAERERVRAELQAAQQRFHAVVTDLLVAFKLHKAAALNCQKAKMSLQQALSKRNELSKKLETEKMWRPPSVVLNQKEQRALRERVKRMRSLLRVKIRGPDDV